MTNISLASKFAVITLLATVTGCSSDAEVEQASQQNESASSSQSGETQVGMETNAEASGSNLEASGNAEPKVTLIPGDFPKDVYIAENPTDAQFSESGGKVNLTLLFAGSDADALVKSFQEGMAEQGWTEVTSSKLPLGTITNFSKDDRKCTISIGPVPDKDLLKVAIMLSSKE